MFKRFIAVAIAGLFMAGMAHAQTSASAPAATSGNTAMSGSSCEAKAVDKNGKPLAGAAKNSFVKKCMKTEAKSSCESKAVGSNGKPLAGAAKASFVKKCEATAAK
ncbi:hypothetical protein [Trinickia sp. EG282A]|uniref:hypothetical protein n=1 Tax=Trinickia sp. EG282A TaxID=3237013 RepID=UPI0034D2A45D